MPRRHRVRLGPCIYQDEYGIDTIVTWRGQEIRERWPLGTDLDVLTAWVHRAKAEALDRTAQAGPPTAHAKGTLTADAQRFLKDREGLPSHTDDRLLLKPWLALYGHLRRSSITTAHINRAIAQWRKDGKSAQTIRHRCRVLRVLWKHLDGKRARSPFADALIPKLPKPHPVRVPIATIQKVLAQMDPSQPRQKGSSAIRWPAGAAKVRARYFVLATTGQRPCQLERATPEDLDLEHGVWTVRGAKGGASHPIALNADMIAAWQMFIAADAWGTFNRHWYRTRIRQGGLAERDQHLQFASCAGDGCDRPRRRSRGSARAVRAHHVEHDAAELRADSPVAAAADRAAA
jgi:integrase